jgi:hypothetical protein
MTTFSSPDILRFLGKRITLSGQLHQDFSGEVVSDCKRWAEGVRVKHSVNGNSVKLYDKSYTPKGSVLRAETTVHNGDDFRVYRRKEGDRKGPRAWRRLPGEFPIQSGKRMSQGLDGVRKAAKERKQERFTAFLHHLNVDLLRDSFFALQRKASPGVDGVTWQEYETGLEDRLVDLHSRVHRGAYRAKPSRRVFIPKADGRQRPLGIAALEDKIVQ